MAAARFWKVGLEADDRAKAVITMAGDLKNTQTLRLARGWMHNRMFSGLRPEIVQAFGAMGYVHQAQIDDPLEPRFEINVLRMVAEALRAQVTENEVRPAFLTDGAPLDAQRKARLLEDFAEGCFYQCKFRTLAPEVLLDALIFGTGCLKIQGDFESGELLAERVLPFELFVGAVDGLLRVPRTMLQRKLIAREVLMEMYPDRSDFIENKATVAEVPHRLDNSISEMIEVWEAWHLPSSKTAPDGRRVVCVKEGHLVDEEWEEPGFPFVFARFSEPPMGFWGEGLGDALEACQININNALDAANEALDSATFKLLVRRGSEIAKAQWSNRISGALEHTGPPPTILETPSDFQSQFLQRIEWEIKYAFECNGVSQTSAKGAKPAGVDSAVGMREVADIEDTRQSFFDKLYQQLHVDAALLFISTAARLHKHADGGFSVKVPGDRHIRTVFWKSIALTRDQYVCKVWPSNLLSRKPQGRMQQVTELMQAGKIPDYAGLRMLGFPDVREELSLQTAGMDSVEASVAKMITDKVFVPPDPMQPLAQALPRVQAYYNQCLADLEPDDERLGLLMDWMDQANGHLKNQAAAAQGVTGPGAPPPRAGPGGPPQAVPNAPPTSDLLPTTPAPAAAA